MMRKFISNRTALQKLLKEIIYVEKNFFKTILKVSNKNYDNIIGGCSVHKNKYRTILTVFKNKNINCLK